MIGIFGGTFDPVHYGHLRSALEVKEIFGLSEVRLIPSAQPPHRKQPATSAVNAPAHAGSGDKKSAWVNNRYPRINPTRTRLIWWIR